MAWIRIGPQRYGGRRLLVCVGGLLSDESVSARCYHAQQRLYPQPWLAAAIQRSDEVSYDAIGSSPACP